MVLDNVGRGRFVLGLWTLLDTTCGPIGGGAGCIGVASGRRRGYLTVLLVKCDRTLPHEGSAAARFGACVRTLAGMLTTMDLEVCLLVEDAAAGLASEHLLLLRRHGRGRGEQ